MGCAGDRDGWRASIADAIRPRCELRIPPVSESTVSRRENGSCAAAWPSGMAHGDDDVMLLMRTAALVACTCILCIVIAVEIDDLYSHLVACDQWADLSVHPSVYYLNFKSKVRTKLFEKGHQLPKQKPLEQQRLFCALPFSERKTLVRPGIAHLTPVYESRDSSVIPKIVAFTFYYHFIIPHLVSPNYRFVAKSFQKWRSRVPFIESWPTFSTFWYLSTGLTWPLYFLGSFKATLILLMFKTFQASPAQVGNIIK